MKAATTPWLLVVPVDLPFLGASNLAPLVEAADPAMDGVVAVNQDSRIQPTVALVWVASVRPVVQAQLTDGRLALRQLVARLKVRTVFLSKRELRNVNRPSPNADR